MLPSPEKIIALAVLAAVTALVLTAGAGPGYRLGIVELGDAFTALRYGTVAAFVAAAAGLAGLLAAARQRRFVPGLLATGMIVIGLGLSVVPILHWQQARHAPPIHDITTDTGNPPAFRALAGAREEAPNAVDYPGESTARQQREAYPDIRPTYFDADLAAVRDAAEATVLGFGWDVASVEESHIEATATTIWFGFQDDVVVRLREESDQVRVDVRSASRLGRGDAGANAGRIRAFLDALEREIGN